MQGNVSTDTKDWSQRVIDLYREGASDAEVAASLRVTVKAFYKQIEDNQAFRELVEFGRTLCQAFWESQPRKNLNNKTFNTSAWAFFMKNKFGWADKVESSSTTETNANINLDDLRAEALKQVTSFIKKNQPELTDARLLLSEIGANLEH